MKGLEKAVEKSHVPKITPELARKMKDSLAALYGHQFGVECTYEEFEETKEPEEGLSGKHP